MRTFLSSTVDAAEARRRVEQRLARREEAFLEVVRRAIYGSPVSPYRHLLEWAGVEFGDLAALVGGRGVEGALESLYDAGVTVTLQEVKGSCPIMRPGLELAVSASDFDNPLATPYWRASTGGSTGAPARINADFDGLETDVVCYRLCLEAFGAREGLPAALWLMAPPGAASLQQLFRTLKVGDNVERWWTPTALSWRGATARHTAFTALTVALARAAGRGVAYPRHLPSNRAGVAADWLQATARSGCPGVFSCTPSTAARVCAAAEDDATEIAGTLFILGGEPYTRATADLVAAGGARGAASYYVSEIGQIGVACAEPEATDEVHLATDALAVIQREREIAGGARVPALVYTTLTASAPKLMLNVESGDYGVLGERDCGCPATEAGLTLHLHTIRSYEKLTLEGMQLFGAELAALVDELLPRTFGGRPQDYQFREERAGTRAFLTLVVSPRVVEFDERALMRTVLDHLRSFGAGHRAMTETLERAGALRMRREEPYVTGAGKTPLLRSE